VSKRRPFQKVLFIIAICNYVAAVGCGVGAAYLSDGSGNPVVASLMASVVFFAGVGIVLHVIGRTDLPDLKI
jgi:hypothetical protein